MDHKTSNKRFGSTAAGHSYSVGYTLIPVILPLRVARSLELIRLLISAYRCGAGASCCRGSWGTLLASAGLPLATSYANAFAVIPRGRTVNLLTQLLDCSGAPLEPKPARGGCAEK